MHCTNPVPVKRGALSITALIAAGLVLLGVPRTAAAGETVAVVNNISISRSSYDRSWPVFLQGKGISPASSDAVAGAAELKREYLDYLVGRELLYQDALQQGYGAEVKDVEREYDRVCRPFRSAADIEETLRRSGFTSTEYKEYLRRRLTVEAYVKARVLPEVKVNSTEVELMLKEKSGEYRLPERVFASHILISVPVDAGERMRRAARQEAEEVLRLITGGADFDKLARTHSDCPSSSRGGDLGFLSRGKMSASFEKAAFGLKPGEISDIVETPFGFHIVRVERRREARGSSREEIEEELRESIRQQKIRSALEERTRELRRHASVVITLSR